jgi:hypothetical protein
VPAARCRCPRSSRRDCRRRPGNYARAAVTGTCPECYINSLGEVRDVRPRDSVAEVNGVTTAPAVVCRVADVQHRVHGRRRQTQSEGVHLRCELILRAGACARSVTIMRCETRGRAAPTPESPMTNSRTPVAAVEGGGRGGGARGGAGGGRKAI